MPTGTETKKNPHAGRRLSTRQGTQGHRGGRRLLHPSTHTRSKYHQPHRSGRQASKRRDAGTDTSRQSVIRTDNGWQPALLGEDGITTNGRRGGKRRSERYTRGKIVRRQGDRGESRRGERGGGQNHQWKGKRNTLTNKGKESSDWVSAVMGLERPPNNDQAIWSRWPDKNKEKKEIGAYQIDSRQEWQFRRTITGERDRQLRQFLARLHGVKLEDFVSFRMYNKTKLDLLNYHPPRI